MVQHPDSEQAKGEASIPAPKRPWVKPVLTETAVQNITESGNFAPPSDGVTGFYQS